MEEKMFNEQREKILQILYKGRSDPLQIFDREDLRQSSPYKLILSKLEQWKGSMCARGHQEVLPPRRRQETLQAIIFVLHPIFFYQIERGLTSTHPGEKFCRRW